MGRRERGKIDERRGGGNGEGERKGMVRGGGGEGVREWEGG